MTLSELGIETQCFAPIPNSLFVCRFDLSEIDLATVKICAENLQRAFAEQNINASVVFIPSELVLERMTKQGLFEIVEHIKSLLEV